MKYFFFFIFVIFIHFIVQSQVGINNTNPKASLDITASNQTNPSNTDGLLIPRIDNFPASNPTADQDGMMVYLTGNGTPTKGYYSWDKTISSWKENFGINVTDKDWYESGNTPPNSINDNIYTNGFVGIGTNSPESILDVNYSGAVRKGVSINYTYTGNTTPPAGLSIKSESTGTASKIFGAYIQVDNSPNTVASYAITKKTNKMFLGVKDLLIRRFAFAFALALIVIASALP